MDQQREPVSGGMEPGNPEHTSGWIANRHQRGWELLSDRRLQGLIKGAEHRPVQNRRQGSFVEKRYAGSNAAGKGRFSNNLGVSARPEDQEGTHRLTGVPINVAMVASPAELIPSRRITFQIVTRKIRKSSQKL